MSRIHLFEFEDLPWFPPFLRNYMTDFLQFLSNKTKLYKPAIPLIQKGLDSGGHHQLIDLGSGGGGGLLWLNREIQQEKPEFKIILTDYYPNIYAFEYTKSQADNFEFIKESIDARHLPENLKGLRTMFLVMHHLKPEAAQKVLQDTVHANQPIAVFEAQERSIPSMLAMLFSPVSIWLTTPFIKPFSWGRLLFTYLIPLVPLFAVWDGIISCLRTYSVKEMNALINKLDNKDHFNWETGRLKSGPGTLLYLLGTPKHPNL